jgi:hypothetical protein
MISAVLVSLAVAGAPSGAGAVFLERLKTLAGEWKGRVQWSGARTDSGTMDVEYSLTGNGTAVVENLKKDSTVVMTSVYHMDGPDLRMTHYCGANNQPRLKATELDEKAGVVRFSFVDVTNLAKPEAGHVSAAELQFRSDREITLTFTFSAGGKLSYERIDLTRATGGTGTTPG